MPANVSWVNCGNIFQRPCVQIERRIPSMSPGERPTSWRAISCP